MCKHFFILVPSDSPSGPVKGAYAIANCIVGKGLKSVSLVFLKDGLGSNQHIDPRVTIYNLSSNRVGLVRAIIAYKHILSQHLASDVVSLSLCLKPDFVNSLMGKYARTYTSMRANIIMNYVDDYGWFGLPLALLHFLLCHRFCGTFVLTHAMKKQLSKFRVPNLLLQRNFVDEQFLEQFRCSLDRNSVLRIGFLGSLTDRKQPLFAVELVHELRAKGLTVQLDLVGEGPLESEIRSYAQTLGVLDQVNISGFLKFPLKEISKCHVFILPSKSEGSSRALMEALFLGIPSVAFDVDGNSELITCHWNGFIARDKREFILAVDELLRSNLNHRRSTRKNLLPHHFRADNAVQSLLTEIKAL